MKAKSIGFALCSTNRSKGSAQRGHLDHPSFGGNFGACYWSLGTRRRPFSCVRLSTRTARHAKGEVTQLQVLP